MEMADKTFGHLPSQPLNGAVVPPLTKQFTSAIKTMIVGAVRRVDCRTTSTRTAVSSWPSRRRVGRTPTR